MAERFADRERLRKDPGVGGQTHETKDHRRGNPYSLLSGKDLFPPCARGCVERRPRIVRVDEEVEKDLLDPSPLFSSLSAVAAPLLTRCPVLLDDGVLLAVAKPDGVLSHPNPGGARAACAFEGRYDPAVRRFDGPAGAIWLVHRLDQDTSGVLLAVRREETAAACRAFFEQRRVRKSYLALVRDLPRPAQGRWQDRLVKRAEKGAVRSAVGRGGTPNAELAYRIGKNLAAAHCSLLQIVLITGRTHQIRVQAAARGHPVAGDRLYGDFTWNRALRAHADLRRLFLHALRLEFPHPRDGAPVRIEAPLPAELRAALDALGGCREGWKFGGS